MIARELAEDLLAHIRECDVLELAEDVLAHIREDDKTPEQGADDYDLVGEIRDEVINQIHQLTSYDCDGDGRIPHRRQYQRSAY